MSMSSSSSDEDEGSCSESLVEVNPEKEEGLEVLLVLRPSNQESLHTRLFLSTSLVQKLVRKLQKGRSHQNTTTKGTPGTDGKMQRHPGPNPNFHPIPVLHPGSAGPVPGPSSGGPRPFHPYPPMGFHPHLHHHHRPYLGGGGRGKFRRGGPWRYGGGGRPFQPLWGGDGPQTQTQGWVRYGGPPSYPPPHVLPRSPPTRPPMPMAFCGQGQFQLQRENIPQLRHFENVPGSPAGPRPQQWMEDEEYVPQPIVRANRPEVREIRNSEESEDYDDDDAFENSSVSSVSSEDEDSTESESEDYGLRAFVAGVTKVVTGGLDKAGFGVWVGEDHEMNFGGVVPTERPQVLKAALIYGGAQCVTALKEKGYSHVDICMESEFLVKNVSSWLEKSKANAEFDISKSSNWDEYKYCQEIRDLCLSFQGMRINWIHLPAKSEGIEKAKKIALEILLKPTPANDNNEP